LCLSVCEHISEIAGPVFTTFLPARRYASAGTSYGPVSVCVCISLPVTSRCSIETAVRIELVLAWRLLSAYFTRFCKEIQVSRKILFKYPTMHTLNMSLHYLVIYECQKTGDNLTYVL